MIFIQRNIDYIDFPEILMEGKIFASKIFGGILSKNSENHNIDLKKFNIIKLIWLFAIFINLKK